MRDPGGRPPNLWPWLLGFFCLCLYLLIVHVLQAAPAR